MLFVASLFSGQINASEFGTASEARSMLNHAIAELKKNPSSAIVAFNSSSGAFRDRDLYVFCGGPDGIFTAHPRATGKYSLRSFKDISGEAIGEEMYSLAKEGEISEISYLLPRGDDPIPYAKTSLITKVGDQICGVGYYSTKQRSRSGNLSINSSLGIVIGGYDAVAYFTIARATKGVKQFSYSWLGSEWYFVNSEHREMFITNPNKYTPQYGGYCANAMAKGSVVTIDPESWQIVNDKLYLLYSSRAKSGWSMDRGGNIAKADARWGKIKPGLSNL
jgi:YHS domain-containing protein